MNPLKPEIRIAEIFLRLVAEDLANILADECWPVVALCLEAVEGRRGTQQKMSKASLGA
jgi:hypothetical protein